MDQMLNAQIPRPEPILLRGREVAELIGCSRALAYRLMQRGAIPTVRIPGGKTIRVPREALLEWIRENTRVVPITSTERDGK
jgi:excisionase family DNA binding protein